jgi:UPF0271 protein
MGASRTPARIDINGDLGEGFGAYAMAPDADIIPYITSANIACGFHAGDPGWMRATVSLAERHRVGVGAHPGFPDLRGFGRRVLHATPEEITNDLVYQIGALTAFTGGKRLQHVKPHGALYNMAVDREDVARAIGEATLAVDRDLILVVLAGSRWEQVARRMGVRVAREVFADRAFDARGALVPRSVPGAVIHDASRVIDRSLRLVVEHRVTAITGEELEIHADTICLHGDTPGAVSLAASLRQAFDRAGVEAVPMAELVAP